MKARRVCAGLFYGCATPAVLLLDDELCFGAVEAFRLLFGVKAPLVCALVERGVAAENARQQAARGAPN